MWYAVEGYDGVWRPTLLFYGTPGVRWYWTRAEAQAKCDKENAR